MNLLWGLGILDGDAGDQNPCAVDIHHLLHQTYRVLSNLDPALIQHEIHALAAHDLTHRTFSGLKDRLVWRAMVEQEIGGAIGADSILHNPLQIDDVLVVGNHEGFARDAGPAIPPESDFNRTQLGDVDQLVILNGCWKAPLKTSWCGALVGTKLGHHTNLTFRNDEEAAS